MSGWHAVVPIKPVAARKMRLRHAYADAAVERLTEAMLWHVLAVLGRSEAIARTSVLAAAPPVGWAGGWLADRGRGLNAELSAVAAVLPRRLLVIHADLPGLTPEDVGALTAAAEATGCAVACDRHRRGTNAIALDDAATFPFAFGPDSLSRHRASRRDGVLIRRPGLALDVDIGEDVALASARGWLADIVPTVSATAA